MKVEDIEIDVQIHTTTTYSCPVCPADRMSLADFERHLGLNHGPVREREIVEKCYADLRSAMLDCPHEGIPHCDDLVLHEPGRCEYCDRFPGWQDARLMRGIAFTGNEPEEWERACPATILRSVEKIERWYGNVPQTATATTNFVFPISAWPVQPTKVDYVDEQGGVHYDNGITIYPIR